MSDEENEDSKNGNQAAIVELMQQMIVPIKTLLEREIWHKAPHFVASDTRGDG